MRRDGKATNATVVTLRLDPGSETISGTLASSHGDERAFWGWLELSGALDELRGTDIRLDERTSRANQSQKGQ